MCVYTYKILLETIIRIMLIHKFSLYAFHL